MREHLKTIGYIQSTTIPTTTIGSRRSSFSADEDSGYSATFRELFCVTAHELARSLDTTLQNLGSLYEDVLTTGTLLNRTIFHPNQSKPTIIAADIATTTKDIEAGFANPILFGKGQLLVLTRRVDTAEANRLQNLGYRFATMEHVGDHLARSLQIPRDDLEDLVRRIHSFTGREPAVPPSGTYLASFLIQPSPGMKGLDVIVPRATPDRLPMVKLSSTELTSRQLKILATFNGLSLDDCLTRIQKRPETVSEEEIFLEKFQNRILDLCRDCPESTLHRATFSARQLDITHGMAGQKESSLATVFAFCGIKEIYIQSLQSLTLKTIPLSLFQAYLRSYSGCPDHAILAQKNHKEFSSLKRVPSITKQSTGRSSKWPSRQRAKATSLPSEMSWQPDSSSEKGLVHVTQSPVTETAAHPWGGIMVTSTQDMIFDETVKDGASMEMQDLGVKAEAGVADPERQTLADRLMSITTGFRDPHAARALPKELYYGQR
jgi:hypothetical protein